MSETVVARAGEQIAETARAASRLTSAMTDAVEEGLGGARRVAKHAGDAAEEFFDDTTAWGGIRWKQSSGPSQWVWPSEL
jgi:hypothetical protein